MTPLIGEIRLFGGNFAPRGWAFCEGQILSIAQNSTLFSIIGTTYGGDGRSTFALPDLRGKTPIGTGKGPGLTDRVIGQSGSAASKILSYVHLPPHSHTPTINATAKVRVSSGTADTSDPQGAYLAVQSSNFYNTNDSGKSYGPANSSFGGTLQVASNGQNKAMENQQPFLTLNYIIAMLGTYPSRS